MVSQSVVDAIHAVHISSFIFLNVVYAFIGIRLRSNKIDRIALIVLLLYYLVFLGPFITAALNYTAGFTSSYMSLVTYIAIQIA